MHSIPINLNSAAANGAIMGIVIAFLNTFASGIYTQSWLTDGLIAYGTIAASMAAFAMVALAANHLSLPPIRQRAHPLPQSALDKTSI